MREKYTRRELQVLDGIGEGLTTKEIAARIGLKPHTVSNHTHILYAITRAQNREELYTIARKELGKGSA